MEKRTLAALVVLNLVLASAFGILHLSSQPAHAQLGMRAPNNYKMVAGDSHQRANQQVVYIVEEDSGHAIALFYNSQNNVWETFDGARIREDIRRIATGRN